MKQKSCFNWFRGLIIMPQHKKTNIFIIITSHLNLETLVMVTPVELSRFSPYTLSLNWLVSMEKQVITVVLKVINSFVMVFFILNCLLLLHCTMCIAKWFAFYLWNFNKIWSKFSKCCFLALYLA